MKTTLKYFVVLGVLATALFAPPMTLEQRLSDVEDRLDDIEFQSGLDKIKFGLDFSVGGSESWYKIGQQQTRSTSNDITTISEEKYKAHNKWSMELNLNMNAAINSYTKFYGRLSMAKNFGMMDASYAAHAPDYAAGRNVRASGQSIYVSRAYVDLFLSREFVLTLGRQPGTDGPGSNLRNNALRQSTYPALLVNALGDAAVISYKPYFMRQLQFVVRGAYGKIYQQDTESGRVEDWTSGEKMNDTDLYYASVEIQPYLGSLGKNTLLMLSYARLKDLGLDLGTQITNYNGVQTLGTIDSVNLHFESYQAFNLPLSYFVSGSYMQGSGAKGAGALKMAQLQLSTDPTQTLFNEESAWAVHAGLRYDFHRLFKLGAEYFHSSQFWFAMTGMSFNDPLNIRATRGQAYDVYIISQIDRNQFFRLSYTHIYNKWSNSGKPLGGALTKDDFGGFDSTADNIMLIYNVKF